MAITAVDQPIILMVLDIVPPLKVLFAAILDGLNKNVNGCGKKLKPPLDKSSNGRQRLIDDLSDRQEKHSNLHRRIS